MRPLYLVFIFLFPAVEIYAQQFIDVSFQKGIHHNANLTVGVVVFDMNNDGYDDIFMPGGYYSDSTRFYKNDHGVFTDATETSGLNNLNHSNTIVIAGAAGDLDNDGFEDLVISKYLCNSSFCNISVYHNNGNNTFTDITASSHIAIQAYNQSISLADINQDGYLDIYIGTYRNGISVLYDSIFNITGYSVNCFPNYLFLNNKNLTFTDHSTQYGIVNNGCTYASRLTDFDFDHDVDILLANDFGQWTNIPNTLYKNNYPNASFSDISAGSHSDQRMYGMGIACGDYNLDGKLDYYITNIGKNILLKNNGDGTFTNTAGGLGVENEWSVTDSSYQTSWGCNFFDADNDGDADLFVASGWYSIDFPYTGSYSPNKFYINNNGTSFTDYSLQAGVTNPLSHTGSAILDFNNDGKMDIICASLKYPRPNQVTDSSHSILYENITTNSNHWLKIKLQGVKNARDAYGSRIAVYTGGKMQITEADGGGGSHSSQSTSYNHFGLGTAIAADSVKVYWLGGRIQTLKNIPANQTITVIEDTTLTITSVKSMMVNTGFTIYPNPVAHSTILHVKIGNDAAIKSYIIADISGREITQGTITESDAHNITIPLPVSVSATEGFYFLTLYGEEDTYCGNFIIVK